MAIRPVDMQMQMPRAMESSRTNAVENARPAAEQQQFASQMQKHTEAERQTVVQSGKTEGQTVNKDGRGNAGGQSQNKKRRRGSADEQTAPAKEKSRLLDISI